MCILCMYSLFWEVKLRHLYILRGVCNSFLYRLPLNTAHSSEIRAWGLCLMLQINFVMMFIPEIWQILRFFSRALSCAYTSYFWGVGRASPGPHPTTFICLLIEVFKKLLLTYISVNLFYRIERNSHSKKGCNENLTVPHIRYDPLLPHQIMRL